MFRAGTICSAIATRHPKYIAAAQPRSTLSGWFFTPRAHGHTDRNRDNHRDTNAQTHRDIEPQTHTYTNTDTQRHTVAHTGNTHRHIGRFTQTYPRESLYPPLNIPMRLDPIGLKCKKGRPYTKYRGTALPRAYVPTLKQLARCLFL